MEFLHSILVISFILFSFILLKTFIQGRGTKLPPGPRQLPVIGNIHQLSRRLLPHRSLHSLAAVHGPVMHLRLGEIPTIIISSADAASEVMKTHDIVFASRFTTNSIDVLSYGGKGFIFAPYGEFWRQMRRLCILDLLSLKRVRSFSVIRAEEIYDLLHSISASSSAMIDLTKMLNNLTNNIMVRAIIGNKCIDQSLYLSVVSEEVEFLSGFSLSDLFPSMQFVGWINGYKRKLKECHKKVDNIIEEIIRKHEEKEGEEDLLDALLRIRGDSSLQVPLSNDHVKAIIKDMFAVGGETTVTTLEWAMSELIRNPTAMKRAQKEVREVFGAENKTQIEVASEETLNQLSYLHSVIKETLRLHPPAPLLPPRESREQCELLGYEIPAKTRLIVNVWAIGRDPECWDGPESFRPERFEESVLDFKGSHFEYIPFGAGRRICPGMNLGLVIVELALAHLLYYFDWEYYGEDGELDMSEAFGITVRRKTPLCLRAIPYVPILPNAYN